MILYTLEESELLDAACRFEQELKISINEDNRIAVQDLGRIDLFSKLGLKRQVLCLIGGPIYDYASILGSRDFAESLPLNGYEYFRLATKNTFPEDFIADSYVAFIKHYFSGFIKIDLDRSAVTFSCRFAELLSFFLRAILCDLQDIHYLDSCKVEASVKVLRFLSGSLPEFNLSPVVISNYLGEVSVQEAVDALVRFGYSVATQEGVSGLVAQAPFYRSDVKSINDLLEDILLIKLGKLGWLQTHRQLRQRSVWQALRQSDRNDLIADVLCSFRFKEFQFPMTEAHSSNSSVNGIVVRNCKGDKSRRIRNSALVSFLNHERVSRHRIYPHRSFEFGYVEENGEMLERLSIFVADQNPDFNYLFSVVHSLFLKIFEVDIRLEELEGTETYFERLCSFSIVNDGRILGCIGVVSDDLLGRLRVKKKAHFAEIDLSTFQIDGTQEK